jgi:ATPase subunit of ABC transporter with duplicated ATPase domains
MGRARTVYGDKVFLDEVTLVLPPGARIGVVGSNGMGESTLLRMMAGLELPTSGSVERAAGVSVGILLQEPPLDEDGTALGNDQYSVAQTLHLLDRYHDLQATPRRGVRHQPAQATPRRGHPLRQARGAIPDRHPHRGHW